MEIATISAAALATGAYLNAKLGISRDLYEIALASNFAARLRKKIQNSRDTASLYHLFELADDNIEALWFEGRTWSYGELKRGEPSSSRVHKNLY